MIEVSDPKWTQIFQEKKLVASFLKIAFLQGNRIVAVKITRFSSVINAKCHAIFKSVFHASTTVFFLLSKCIIYHILIKYYSLKNIHGFDMHGFITMYVVLKGLHLHLYKYILSCNVLFYHKQINLS